jgi:hypothetical protein
MNSALFPVLLILFIFFFGSLAFLFTVKNASGKRVKGKLRTKDRPKEGASLESPTLSDGERSVMMDRIRNLPRNGTDRITHLLRR